MEPVWSLGASPFLMNWRSEDASLFQTPLEACASMNLGSHEYSRAAGQAIVYLDRITRRAGFE